MAVSRWDPFRDLASIQNELNRLFGRAYGTEVAEGGEAAWVPPIDVYETEDRYVIYVELPGVASEDVEISVEDATLAIQGERRFYGDVPAESFHRVERRFGRFSRNLSLPQVADAERIEASFDAGVLTVTVPKKEEARPKRITVKATG